MDPHDGLGVAPVTAPFLSDQWHRIATLRPRLRHHVQAHRHLYRKVVWYVVEDGLSGRQTRLSASTYMLVGLLNGRRTVDEAWQEIVDRLGDAAPSQDTTLRTLAHLHALDLLQSDLPPSTSELFERREQAARAALLGRFANPLALRIPLVDPDYVLSRTAHLTRPLFSAAGAILWLLLIAPTLVLVGIHWPELSADFVDRVLARESLFAMALVYPFTKLIHELGHGYAVKRWGGSVHEFGANVLILIPMPYLDASDAGAFRSKWSRIVVGAAGMMAELAVAALALFVWDVSEPGMVRSVAYATMVSASIGTLVFNANPLMRFDGYYIVADLIEMPNLGQRSSRFWRWMFGALIGQDGGGSRQFGTGMEVFWCVLYAPLAFAWRITLTFGIGAFVAQRFFYAGAAIAIWGAVTMLAWPLARGVWALLTMPALEGRRARATLTVGVLAAIVVAILGFVPVPLHSTAEGVVWMPTSGIIRASEDGMVAGLAVSPGTLVHASDALFRLEDIDLAASIPLRLAELSVLDARLASEIYDKRVEAAVTRQEFAYKQSDLASTLAHVARLSISATADGLFVVPRADDLPGRFVHRGEVLGFVAPAGGRIVRVVVKQADVDLVRNRLSGVSVLAPGRTAAPISARLVREVPGGLERLPSEALSEAGGGQLAADPRDQHRTLTLQRTFVFDLELAADQVPSFGQRVQVRFDFGTEPVGFSVYRRLRQLVLSRFDA